MLSLLGKEEKPKEATKEGAKNGETSTESATAKTGTVKLVLTDTSVKRTPPYYRHSISVPSYFAIFYVKNIPANTETSLMHTTDR